MAGDRLGPRLSCAAARSRKTRNLLQLNLSGPYRLKRQTPRKLRCQDLMKDAAAPWPKHPQGDEFTGSVTFSWFWRSRSLLSVSLSLSRSLSRRNRCQGICFNWRSMCISRGSIESRS